MFLYLNEKGPQKKILASSFKILKKSLFPMSASIKNFLSFVEAAIVTIVQDVELLL